jgi:hypothetical protein
VNRLTLIAAPLITLLLASCGDAPAPHSASTSAEPVMAETAAEPVAPGLLLDPRFEIAGDAQSLRHWTLSQHAGASSYEYDVEDGVLSLRRIGVEPWGIIQQQLDANDWAGKTMEFSADLAAELDDSYGAPFDATGLSVSALGFGPGDLPMMGKRILLAATQEPGLDLGEHGWKRHRLRFTLPEATEVDLRLSVQLTYGGELKMRSPSLVIVESN